MGKCVFDVAGMKHLGLEDIDEDCAADVSVSQVEDVAKEIVTHYVDLTIPNLQETGSIR